MSALIAGLVLAILISSGEACAQTDGAAAEPAQALYHVAHDRSKVPKAQRAEDMVRHGEEMRRTLEDFAAGTLPCPQTPPEWADATALGAQWKAYREVRNVMKTEFADQLEGTALGQRYDEVFDSRRTLGRGLEARVRACNPPASVIKGPQEILDLVAHMIAVEKGLAGIVPLAVIAPPSAPPRRRPER